MTDLIIVISVSVLCAILSFIVYGCWRWEQDRYEYRKKYGIDPKYHGWKIDDKNQDK
jgi:hypothetical protein